MNASGGTLEAEINELEQRQADLGAMYANAEISKIAFQQSDRLIAEKLHEKQIIHSRLTVDPLPPDLVRLDETIWEHDLDFDQQRALIDLFVDHVIVEPKKPGATRAKFDPNRVHIVPRLPR